MTEQSDEARLARNAYMRDWNRMNREKVNADRRQRSTERSPEEIERDRARGHARYERHKDVINARARTKRTSLPIDAKQALLAKEQAAAKVRYRADPAKQKSASTRWRQAHPERVRELRAAQNLRNQANGKPLEWHWKHKFGMTIEEGMALFDAQGGLCAICGTALERPAYGNRSTHLDHDHVTKCVRGFLCINCNHGLGNFLDEPDLLEIAVEYLRAW